ncbi:MAG: iron-sulfur cluster assembly accessory protein [Pantoea sp. Brub]|nr:iron-sulfur cluster assembly accessory protein [Pantoea sp. Brub]
MKEFSPNNTIWKGITLTKNAAKQIIKLNLNHPKSTGLLINIKKSGCAGFSYMLNLTTNISGNEIKFSYYGADVFVPIQAMPFIDGMEIDYIQDGLNEVFKFNNPKAQYSCGCGDSFSIE